MLARHLLFLATRRPNQALLAIQQQPQQQQQQQQPSEQVSTVPCPQHHHHHQQQQQQQPIAPPPYVGPPQVSHSLQQHDEYQASAYERRGQRGQAMHNHHHRHHHHEPPAPPHGQQHILEPYQRFTHDKRNLQYLAYAGGNQNIYGPQPSSQQHQQQFFTLPNRRAQRDVALEPPRSITPDVISSRPRPMHAPLSSMHMLARQGSPDKFYQQQQQQQQAQQVDCNRKRLEQQYQQQQQRQAPLDVRNRFASPVGPSAVGYRLFASPIQQDAAAYGSPRSGPISPIGPEQANGFRSSTPSATLAERLALHSQRCASPKPTPDSAVILSPIKTTMSNEELFAAIHKSKRRLNIRDEPESLSPAGSLSSLASQTQQIATAGTRHSWSPESHKTPEIPKAVPASVAATSRMDFKRLLLQQSIKSGPIRVSAAEQLKLSRQQCQEQQQQSQQQAPPPQPQTPTKSSTSSQQLAKVLSPRSAWRFQTPRTDVLSSTIIEDAAAEEKAMKPSPEAPVQAATRQQYPSLNSRRQLDLGPEASVEQLKNRINDAKSSKCQQRSLEKREKELENRLQLIDSKVSQAAAANVEQDPVKAIENRRISNQLARAQFLASAAPAPAAPSGDLFSKRFRARSESPQQNNPQRTKASGGGGAAVDNATENPVVTRSPSAPALETAL